MSTGKEHQYIIKNGTTVVLHFAIYQDLKAKILHIYVAESERILKNMFPDLYYNSLNPDKSMLLEATSPQAEIKEFTIIFGIKAVLNVYGNIKEYVITAITKRTTRTAN